MRHERTANWYKLWCKCVKISRSSWCHHICVYLLNTRHSAQNRGHTHVASILVDTFITFSTKLIVHYWYKVLLNCYLTHTSTIINCLLLSFTGIYFFNISRNISPYLPLIKAQWLYLYLSISQASGNHCSILVKFTTHNLRRCGAKNSNGECKLYFKAPHPLKRLRKQYRCRVLRFTIPSGDVDTRARSFYPTAAFSNVCLTACARVSDANICAHKQINMFVLIVAFNYEDVCDHGPSHGQESVQTDKIAARSETQCREQQNNCQKRATMAVVRWNRERIRKTSRRKFTA